MGYAPTAELLRHRPDYDAPKQSRQKDRPAYKLNSVVDRLQRLGDITREEHEAANRFYSDAVKGMQAPGLISSYGERMGGSTPISQQDNTRLTPDERRAYHYNAAQSAIEALTEPKQHQMVWLCLIEEKPLHEASMAVFGGSRNAASGAGKYALTLGIKKLKEHYETKYK